MKQDLTVFIAFCLFIGGLTAAIINGALLKINGVRHGAGYIAEGGLGALCAVIGIVVLYRLYRHGSWR